MKTAVIGYSGSGKSTLSERIAAKQHVPVLHIDCVHWLPGWKARPSAESTEIVGRFMDENDGWVIDGNYSKHHYERRIEEADRIIFMNFGRFNCLYRALKRRIRYHGKTRSSMTVGCPEKFDWAFIKWILYEGRSKGARARYQGVLDSYPEKCVMLRNQRDLDNYVKQEKL